MATKEESSDRWRRDSGEMARGARWGWQHIPQGIIEYCISLAKWPEEPVGDGNNTFLKAESEPLQGKMAREPA